MIAHSRLNLSLSLGLEPHRCSPLSVAARVISHSRIVECVAVKLGASESVGLRLQQLPGEARAHDEQDPTNLSVRFDGLVRPLGALTTSIHVAVFLLVFASFACVLVQRMGRR